MLKDNWLLITRFARLVDNLIVVIAFYLAYAFRDVVIESLLPEFLVREIGGGQLGEIHNYLFILGIALPLYNGCLSLFGAYQRLRFSSVWSLLRIASLSSFGVFLGIGATLFIFKLDYSRSFVSLFCLISGLLIFIQRIATLQLLRSMRKRGKNFRNILIVGTGELARKLYLDIVRQPELGVRVVGFVDRDLTEVETAEQYAWLGSGGGGNISKRNTWGTISSLSSRVYDLPSRVICGPTGFEAALKRCAVDEVLFAQVSDDFGLTRELAEIAAEEGVRVSLAADFFGMDLKRSEFSQLGDVPLIHYHQAPSSISALLVKRTIDVLVSGALLALLSPMLLLIALAIKIDSSGPVLFKQKRVGLNGRIFVLLKFRSMVANAEALLEGLKAFNEMKGPVFKLSEDPRITRVGKFIRRYSLDELPQLINVFRGDMSLVGPRPPLPEEVANYRRRQRRRLSMRPGITCIWQVSGRNEIPDFEDWARLDLEYIDNWSLWGDFKLLLRTIPAVLIGTGAR